MTALQDYERLEAVGLWRPAADEQRRDVIVSIGDASLIITDIQDRALAHWSLPAVMRANPGTRPAIYHPDGDPGETLELSDDEAEMIAAIEKLRRALARGTPRPGRIRLIAVAAVTLALLAAGLLWLPDALRSHAVSVVPQAKRSEIGAQVLASMQRLTGTPCRTPRARAALDSLRARLGSGPLVVVPNAVRGARALPGGTIVIGRDLVELHEQPDVLAGYLVAEMAGAKARDPLGRLLDAAGPRASFRLLTTGVLPVSAIDRHAERLVTRLHPQAPRSDLVAEFEQHAIRGRPYAYARDPSGETTLDLIEADPFLTENARPVLSDGAWVALQGICDG